jgi:hypothetical protein
MRVGVPAFPRAPHALFSFAGETDRTKDLPTFVANLSDVAAELLE